MKVNLSFPVVPARNGGQEIPPQPRRALKVPMIVVLYTTGLILFVAVTLAGRAHPAWSFTILGGTAALMLMVKAETGLFLFFGYIMIEGMLKLLTNVSPLMQLGREILLGCLLFRWAIVRIGGHQKLFDPTPVQRYILAFVAVCFAQVFNPWSPSWVTSLGGIKLHLSMIPLYFLTFSIIHSKSSAARLFAIMTVVGLVVAVVGIVQYPQGPERISSLSESYHTMAEKSAWYDYLGQKHYRPLSTTSLTGGSAMFAQVTIPLTWALLLLSRTVIARLACGVAVITMLASAMDSGTRLPFALAIITLILMIALHISQQPRSRIKQIVLGGTIITMGIWLAWYFTGGIISERATTILHPLETWDTTQGKGYESVWWLLSDHPLGVGMGRIGGASGSFAGILREARFSFTNGENYFAVMMSEMGVPGLALALMITGAFIRRGIRTVYSVQDRELKIIAAALLSFLVGIFLAFFKGAPLVMPPYNSYFWALAGVLMKLPQLEGNAPS